MEKEEKIKKQKEFLIKVVYWSVWALAIYALIRLLGSVLFPFFIAFLLAWLLSKPVDFITRKTGMRRGIPAFGVTILFFAAVIGILYLIGFSLSGVMKRFLTELTYLLSGSVLPMLLEFLGRFEVTAGSSETLLQTGEVLSELSSTMVDYVSDVASCIPGFCMNVLLVVIATILMEVEFPSILHFLERLFPEKWQRLFSDGKTNMRTSIGKYLLAYGLIFGMTFLELLLGLLLLRIKGAVSIAFFIAVLDILPVLGTGTVLLPWCVICIATGDLKLGVGLLILYLVITFIRNLVEPRLVGKQMGLSPVVMLPCLLIGYKLFGILGFIVLPFGLALLKYLNESGMIHLFGIEEKM